MSAPDDAHDQETGTGELYMARNRDRSGPAVCRSLVTVGAVVALVVGILAASATATPQSDTADA